MERVAIVIVNYNASLDTTECAQSLSTISHKKMVVKTFIVDNGSKDHYVLPRRFDAQQFEVVRSEANLGFTGGNNLGIEFARKNFNPDYILLLNNDTTVNPDFLEKMVECAHTNVKAGVVGAKIYFSKGREYHKASYDKSELGSVFWFAGGSIDWQHMVAFHRGVDEVDRGQFDEQFESDYITGCAMLIPVSVIERVGVLDEKYFVYMEDVEYSIRVAQAGFELFVCQDAVIWHKNAGSSGGAGSNIHRYYQTRNRLYFGWKYGDRSSKTTVFRIALAILRTGDAVVRKAVWHALTGTMGKQPIF